MKGTHIQNVDQYLAGFPPETKKLLTELRDLVRKNAPEAEEFISYQMPAYKLFGMLVYFAGYEKHIGFYPGASGIENFKNELINYKTSKGTLQLPINKPIPEKLIAEIVRFRLNENIEKHLIMKKKK